MVDEKAYNANLLSYGCKSTDVDTLNNNDLTTKFIEWKEGDIFVWNLVAFMCVAFWVDGWEFKRNTP